MQTATPLSFDGLIVAENYLWDGLPHTKNQSHHYFPAAWGSVTNQPVLLVNMIPPWQTPMHPKFAWRFRPGLHRTASPHIHLLNIWQDDWREGSHRGDALPVASTVQQIRAAARALHMAQPVLMVSEPAHGVLFGQCGERWSVWFCSDDFAASDIRRAQSIRQNEEKFLPYVDLVLAVSPTLAEKWRSQAKQVLLVPSAVDAEELTRYAAHTTGVAGWPADKIRHPCVVYLGSLNERVDYDCLLQTIRQCADVTFLFIGPMALDAESSPYAGTLAEVQSAPNSIYLGRRNRREISWILTQCDAGIIPYLNNDFNRSCSPVKAYEYSALGLPTIATPLPAIELMQENVCIAKSSQFAQALRHVMADLPLWRTRAHALLASNTWQDRVLLVQRKLQSMLVISEQ